MGNPLVSVIMAVYNCEKYIKASIESILNQTFSDFELIIVLDGCTDNTNNIIISILNDYDGRYQVIRETKNKGCPHARSVGVAVAKGDILLIQDADDISIRYRMDKQVNFMRKNPDIFCVGSWAEKIDCQDNIIGKMTYPPENNDEIIKAITKKCINPILDPTVSFWASDFNEIGGYTSDKSIWTVPDFDLWLRAILAGKKFFNIQEPLVRYRVNEEGITRKNKEEMIKQHMIVWNNFMRKR